MSEDRYRLGITSLADKTCFHQTSINFGERGSSREHIEKIIVYGSEDGRKSSIKIAKKIVKLLNKDLDKKQEFVTIKVPVKLANKVGVSGVESKDLVFECTEVGERSPACVTGSEYPQGIVLYRKEG